MVCNRILVLVNLITFQMNIIYVSRTACGKLIRWLLRALASSREYPVTLTLTGPDVTYSQTSILIYMGVLY